MKSASRKSSRAATRQTRFHCPPGERSYPKKTPGTACGENLGSFFVSSTVDLKSTRQPKGISGDPNSRTCRRVQGVVPSEKVWVTLYKRQKHLIAKGQYTRGRPAFSSRVRDPSTTVRTMRSAMPLAPFTPTGADSNAISSDPMAARSSGAGQNASA